MPKIEILDGGDNTPFIDLAKILAAIQPFAQGLDWHFVDLEPVRLVAPKTEDGDPPSWVSNLFQEIRENPNGVKLEWQKLEAFARHIYQTVDAILIGVRPGTHPPIAPVDLSAPEYDVVIQAIDGDVWVITSRNKDLIERVQRNFTSTKIIE
ncbi:MAG TPA: hypothetical protein VKZ53_19220 [Candidatus Angelobacter sp.]|nr:hypothetical protein [Candidatus Angelobacter sp.]